MSILSKWIAEIIHSKWKDDWGLAGLGQVSWWKSCYLEEGHDIINWGGKQRNASQADCCEQGVQCEDLSQETESLQKAIMGELIGAKG